MHPDRTHRTITIMLAIFALILFVRYGSAGRWLYGSILATEYLIMAALINVSFGKYLRETPQRDKKMRFALVIILVIQAVLQFWVAR